MTNTYLFMWGLFFFAGTPCIGIACYEYCNREVLENLVEATKQFCQKTIDLLAATVIHEVCVPG